MRVLDVNCVRFSFKERQTAFSERVSLYYYAFCSPIRLATVSLTDRHRFDNPRTTDRILQCEDLSGKTLPGLHGFTPPAAGHSLSYSPLPSSCLKFIVKNVRISLDKNIRNNPVLDTRESTVTSGYQCQLYFWRTCRKPPLIDDVHQIRFLFVNR